MKTISKLASMLAATFVLQPPLSPIFPPRRGVSRFTSDGKPPVKSALNLERLEKARQKRERKADRKSKQKNQYGK